MDQRISNINTKMTNIPTVSESVNISLTKYLMIVKDKFKQGEMPIALFEAYQIIRNEHENRLLTLVQSTGTYAIFSFKAQDLPPKSMTDLSIDKIFPLNDGFELKADKMELRFSLKSYYENVSEFFYYPLSRNEINNFEKFQEIVNRMTNEYARKQSNINQIPNQVPGAKNEIVMSPVVNSFKWLESYKTKNEDESKELARGETRFQYDLRKREKEYIIYKSYRIYCATWNINSLSCPGSDLSLWLAGSEDPPDIYVIALQEFDFTAIAIYKNERKPDPIWNRKFLESLNKNAKYEQLTSVRLVGMQLTIFVREELRPSVIRCNTHYVGTGICQFGNKGAVAVSVAFNEADLCFVNSHFAAHMQEVAARNQDYDTIDKKCIFADKRHISDHDHIFWIGDLNYRIIEMPGLSYDYSDYDNLLRFDQLRMEMRQNNVFNGYKEGAIKFRPTYKYDIGTDDFDSSEKHRLPAYCDRVLWKGERINQISYGSVMEIRHSDHKPVYAEFITKIKTKDMDRYKRVYEETLKSVDKYENDNRPQITVERMEINFDEVTFNELAIRDFTIANNCHLPVEFSFEQHENIICHKYFDVEPKSGRLIPGSSISIRVKFQTNSETIADFVQKLNSSQKEKPVFGILILRVKDGPHSFISILGTYIPSCFGLPVETLCQIERPVCKYTIEELNELGTIKDTFRVSIPREFFLLIDYLHTRQTRTEGLFSPHRHYSNSEQINLIRDWLDSWSSEEFPGNPHTAAETLLLLLESPKEPLLKPCAERLLTTKTIDEAMSLITTLSPPRRNLFIYLCLFLREGINNRLYNIEEIATLFGDILTKKKSEQVRGTQDGRCRLMMLMFLKSDLGIFTQISNILVFNHEDV